MNKVFKLFLIGEIVSAFIWQSIKIKVNTRFNGKVNNFFNFIRHYLNYRKIFAPRWMKFYNIAKNDRILHLHTSLYHRNKILSYFSRSKDHPLFSILLKKFLHLFSCFKWLNFFEYTFEFLIILLIFFTWNIGINPNQI